jgi:hypothetical protein
MTFKAILQGNWYRGNDDINKWLESNKGKIVTVEMTNWEGWKIRLTGKMDVSDAIVELEDYVVDENDERIKDDDGDDMRETIHYRVYIVRSKDGYMTLHGRNIEKIFTDISTIHLR